MLLERVICLFVLFGAGVEAGEENPADDVESDSEDEDYRFNLWEWEMMGRSMLPRLDTYKKKGDVGRFVFVGGSIEYASSLFLAAVASIKAGADWVYVITTREAASVVQAYSPDIIVCPYLDNYTDHEFNIETLFDLAQVVVIGPGLPDHIDDHLGDQPWWSRKDPEDENEYTTFVEKTISACKERHLPLIISDRGLDIISKNFTMIKNYPPPGVILIGHYNRFIRVQSDMESQSMAPFESLGPYATLLVWAEPIDYFTCKLRRSRWLIYDGFQNVRRCDSRGDILTGVSTTLFRYAAVVRKTVVNQNVTAVSVSSYAAAKITRTSDDVAYRYHRRDSFIKESRYYKYLGSIGKSSTDYYTIVRKKSEKDNVFRQVPGEEESDEDEEKEDNE